MPKNAKKPQIRFKGFTDAWEQRKLGDVGEIITGSTPSTLHPEYYSEEGLPWVTPTDINQNIIFNTDKKLSIYGEKVSRIVPPGSILVTCIASIGKNAMLTTAGSFNQQINGLIPNFKNYNSYFLLTASFLWSAKMIKEAAAGTMQIVNKNEFTNINTYIPTLKEQKIIGAYFNNLDNLITLHQRKLDKLKNIKKSMLEKMFPKNGSNIPEIRFKGFTDAWEQRKLGEIAETYSGGTPSVTIKKYYIGNIPFIRSAEINSKNTELFINEDALLYSSAKRVSVGDILYALYGATSGEVGRAALNGAINQAVLAILPQKNYDSEYLMQWLCKSKFKIIGTFLQGGQGNLSAEIVKNLNIDFPIYKEQIIIGIFLHKLDNLITLHQRKLEKLQNIKKACLEKMFV